MIASKLLDKQKFLRANTLQNAQRFGSSGGAHHGPDKASVIKYSLIGALTFGVGYGVLKSIS